MTWPKSTASTCGKGWEGVFRAGLTGPHENAALVLLGQVRASCQCLLRGPNLCYPEAKLLGWVGEWGEGARGKGTVLGTWAGLGSSCDSELLYYL